MKPQTTTRFPRGLGVVALVAFGAAAGLFVFLKLAATRINGQIFWSEIETDEGIAWLCAILIVAAPLLLAFGSRLPVGNWGRALVRNRRWVFASGAVFYALLMVGVARNVAYTPDESGAILQARALASGRLSPRVSPELVQLVTPHILQGDIVLLSKSKGTYTTGYWPGYAILMAPFALFHLEWLCNPILSALTLAALFLLARRLSQSDEAGMWAAVLALASAQVALQGASYFSMPAHLLFNTLFCLALIQNTRRGAFVAGLVGGFALVLHNPAPHLSFAFPWIVWIALRRRAQLAPLLLGYALLFLPLGLGWSAHLQAFDAGRYVGAAATATATGVQAHSGFSEVLSRVLFTLRPPDNLLLLARGAAMCKTVVWAAPGLAGLALISWLQLRRAPLQNSDAARPNASYLRLLGVSLVFNFALYLLVRFDQAHGWGFRYLHQSWMFFPILGAHFLSRSNGTWKRLAALWCFLGIGMVIPLRLVQMREIFALSERARPPIPKDAASISFVRERDQGEVWIWNDPFLRDPHWNLRFTSQRQNENLARRFLQNPRRVQSASWGETWGGTGFSRPGSP